MCGIFGVIQISGEMIVPDQDRLASTAADMEHRGPDDRGIHFEAGFGTAHTRLSLLDLNPRSAQPFWDADRRFCLVYNGEVYNFRELRRALESEGVEFRTTSDTEVVLHALIRWGVAEALPLLEGMFSLAFWDTQTRQLHLARDRFGIKPMFLKQDAGRLLFASEISLFQRWVELEPDMRTVTAFLYGSGGPTSGRSFFEGVSQLRPGTVVHVDQAGTVTETRFAVLSDMWDRDVHEELQAKSDDEHIETVERLLGESIEQQLIADARVGVLCSGGVDSSLMLALASKSHDDLAVFHADVVGRTSEYEAAASLAKHLGLDLEVVRVTDDDFIDLLPKLTLHNSSPFHLNPHSVPFFKVAELVRDSGVKAVLSGEGADEAYLGYPWSAPDRFMRKQNRSSHHPSRTRLDDGDGGPARQVDLLGGMLEGFTTELDHETNLAAVGAQGEERDRAVETLDLLHSNLQGLLHRNDTMGMAASVESRFPFLDTALMTNAVNLPARLKIRRGLNLRDRRHPWHIDKWVLRQVADRHLPEELSRRKKIPFSTTAYERVEPSLGFFADGFVSDLFGLTDDTFGYWLERIDQRLRSKLVHLESWGRVFFRDESPESVGDHLRTHVTLRP